MMNSCREELRLVSYTIIFTKRGLEVAFREQQELVSDYASLCNFQTWKIAEFVQSLPFIPVPPKWRAKGYPPAASGGRINALPRGDGRYLRVHCQALRRYPREAFQFQERQLEELEKIRDALLLKPPCRVEGLDRSLPHPGVSRGVASTGPVHPVPVERPKEEKHAVRLPQSMRLGGGLNLEKSKFGDEFFNFPPEFGEPAAPGGTRLAGWVEVEFQQPQGHSAEFELKFFSQGSFDQIVFGGGQEYDFLRNRAFPSLQASQLDGILLKNGGRLNLKTGEVEEVQLNAKIQNSVIAQVNRLNRIPFAFPFIYPPITLTSESLGLPSLEEPELPPVCGNLKFSLDSEGKIIGLELHSKTIVPVALFPFVPNLFPPFSFGPDKAFFFANPLRCREGTPPKDCPDENTHPDGVKLALDVFFHPYLDLVAEGVQELPDEPCPPPCARQEVAGAPLVAVDGRLFLLGGFNLKGTGKEVFVYDPAVGEWLVGPAMSRAAAGAQATALGKCILLAGGWAPRRKTPLDMLQILDTETLQWSQGKDLLEGVADGAAVAAQGKAFLIGGWKRRARGGLALSSEVQIFDPSVGKWQAGHPAPQPVASAAAVAVGDRIFVINGRGDGKLVHQTLIYHIGENRWEEGPQTLCAVYQAAAGRIGDMVYLLGGRASIDGPTLAQVQILDLLAAEPTWRPGIPLPVPTASSGGAVLEDTFYLVGGRIQTGPDAEPGSLTDLVQVYRPPSGWEVCRGKPHFTSAGVLNGAGATAAPLQLSPGSRAILSGLNLAPSQATVEEPVQQLSGVSIQVDGQPAPILSVSPERVDFLIPEIELDGVCRKVRLALCREDFPQQAPPVLVDLQPVAPGLYIYNYSELFEPDLLCDCAAVACNQDGSFNCASQPAIPGEEVTLYATGLGCYPEDPRELQGHMRVLVGPTGKQARVLAVSPLEGRPGIHQVRAKLPEALWPPLSNNVLVLLSVAGVKANPAVIAIREKAYRLDPPILCERGLDFFFPKKVYSVEPQFESKL